MASWLRGLNYGNEGRLVAPYEQSVAVFRCVQVIAGSLSRVPLALYRGEERLDVHPLTSLLARPNSLMTQAKLVQTIVSHQLLDGVAFVYLDDPDSRNVPRSLLPLPPGQVTPIRTRNDLYGLRGWSFSRGQGESSVLPVDRVARFEYAPHPSDPLRGVSPLNVSRLVVETDHLANVWNRATLENSGTPAGVLRWKGEGRLDEKDARLVRQQWLDTYGGANNADSIAVLGSNFEWQSIGTSARDMQWLDARRFNLADIARAFAVPLVFLNEFESSGLSDAGMRVQTRILYTGAVIPLATQIQQVLTDMLVRPLDPELALYFDFDGVEALRDDMTEKLEQGQRLVAAGYPLNHVNRKLELGMDDVAWGDQALVSTGLTTAESIVTLGTLPADDTTATTEVVPVLSPATVAEVVALVEKVAAGSVPPGAAKQIMVQLYGLAADVAATLLDGVKPREVVQAQAAAPASGVRAPAQPVSLGFDLEPGQVVERLEIDRARFPSLEAALAVARAHGLEVATTEETSETWVLHSPTVDGLRPRSRRHRRIGDGVRATVTRTDGAYRDAAGAWRLPEHRLALWRARIATTEKLEAQALSRVRRKLIDARAKVLRALDDAETNSRALPTDTTWIDRIAGLLDPQLFPNALRKFVDEAVDGSVRSAVKELIAIGVADESSYDAMGSRLPQIRDRYYAARLRVQLGVGEKVRDAMRATLLDGFRNGENLSDMKDRVRAIFNVTAQRARTVARTEVNIASSEGQWAVYEHRRVERIEWLSAGDEHVRSPDRGDEFDHDIDGDIVDRGEAFSNGLRYPRSPEGEPGNVINCRCAFVAIVDE